MPLSSTRLADKGEREGYRSYCDAMNWFAPTEAHAVPRSVALRDQVYAPTGGTGESCVIGG